jgi:hypothetical protein
MRNQGLITDNESVVSLPLIHVSIDALTGDDGGEETVDGSSNVSERQDSHEEVCFDIGSSLLESLPATNGFFGVTGFNFQSVDSEISLNLGELPISGC